MSSKINSGPFSADSKAMQLHWPIPVLSYILHDATSKLFLFYEGGLAVAAALETRMDLITF
jgi:hypothetical protein